MKTNYQEEFRYRLKERIAIDCEGRDPTPEEVGRIRTQVTEEVRAIKAWEELEENVTRQA